MQDTTASNRQLVYLNDVENTYQVAEGDPDIRGWSVLARDGRRLGEVSDLLVDIDQMKVRYLEVELDNALRLGGPQERYTLIPIGVARVRADTDQVLVDIDATGVPLMRRRAHAAPLERAEEVQVLGPYQARTAKPGDDFYTDPRFDDAAFLRDRRAGSGPLGYIRRP
jgi:sporulation protein YlmC with PRC-barrel domain